MRLKQLRNFDTARSEWPIKESEQGKTTAFDNYLARKISRHPNFEWRRKWRGVDCFDLLREQCLNNFIADCRTFSADEDPRNQFIVVQIVDLISDVYHLRLMYI